MGQFNRSRLPRIKLRRINLRQGSVKEVLLPKSDGDTSSNAFLRLLRLQWVRNTNQNKLSFIVYGASDDCSEGIIYLCLSSHNVYLEEPECRIQWRLRIPSCLAWQTSVSDTSVSVTAGLIVNTTTMSVNMITQGRRGREGGGGETFCKFVNPISIAILLMSFLILHIHQHFCLLLGSTISVDQLADDYFVAKQ
jgi:hypothetical protein